MPSIVVQSTPSNPFGVKALAFDVFGTAVDWRGTIVREGAEWGKAHGLSLDWGEFADRWRAGYGPAMQAVRSGALPWTGLDGLHRRMLDGLLEEFGIGGLSEEEIAQWNRVWHRLDPWPDAAEGVARLKPKYVVSALSNGNLSLLVNLSKHAALPWDVILSVEFFRHYKPDREVYLGSAELLGCKPSEVMMVAAHIDDLEGAAACGLRTAFVSRPLEHGPRGRQPAPPASFDVYATDFLDLADKLM
jgi:2-haloacid dehalogenase